MGRGSWVYLTSSQRHFLQGLLTSVSAGDILNPWEMLKQEGDNAGEDFR